MKRNCVLGGLLIAGITLWLHVGYAQPLTNSLEGLQLIPAGQVPIHGSFWSMANPKSPPCPIFVLRDLGEEAPDVYALGPGEFLVDDRGVPDSVFQARSATLSSGSQSLISGADYGCGLWLDISAITNSPSTVLLTLHNTRQSQTYTIWSIANLALTNWAVETNVTGAGGDFTEALIAKGGRSLLFFKASESRDYLVDTNATFTGLGYSDTLVDPPNSMGAVGPNHFVELLNCGKAIDGAIAGIVVYDKSGTSLATNTTLDFFHYDTNHPGPLTQFMADPRILYDSESGRWVACAIDVGSGEVILAVSATDSPTNLLTGWTKYLLPVHQSPFLTDFTTLGLDGNGIYVRVFHYGGSGNTNAGHTVVAIKKPEIYKGILVTNILSIPAEPSVWTVQPVVNFDPVAATNYAWFVAKGPPNLSSNYQGGAIWYHRLEWNGTNAAWAETNWLVVADSTNTYRDYYDLDGTNLTVASQGGRVFAPQPGETNGISLHDVGSRLATPVIRNSVLWTCQAVGLDTQGAYSTNDWLGTNVSRSGIQWVKMRVDNSGSLTHDDHGRIWDRALDNPTWYHFPSLAVNCAGDVVFGFSGSSLTNYIGAFWSWLLPNGKLPDGPQLLRPGLTNYLHSFTNPRWGDYSATTADPADDWAFWTVQEYADPGGADADGNYTWKTVISRIRPSP